MRERPACGRCDGYLRLHDEILPAPGRQRRRYVRHGGILFGEHDVFLVDKKDPVVRNEKRMRFAQKRIQLDDELPFVTVPCPALDLIEAAKALKIIFGVAGDLTPNVERNVLLVRRRPRKLVKC